MESLRRRKQSPLAVLAASEPCRSVAASSRRSNRNVKKKTDPFQEVFDFEWLVEKVVCSGSLQLLDSILFHHTGDTQDPDIIQIGVGADDVTDVLSIDIRKHDVEDDEVRVVLFDHHPGAEAVIDGPDFKPAITFEDVADEFDQFFIVINDQDFVFRVLQVVDGNSVFPHESDQLVTGNTTESASRNAKSLQLARIEAANNRLLTDLTDLGRFTCGEDGLTREW